MLINFSDIPNNQNLFLDYLYEFENVSEFYKYDFRAKENYGNIFKKIIESRKNKDLKLASILKNQYSDLPDASKKTISNIVNLDEERTLAIVTGQQLGLLGGPLYTLYKIITAIKLSRQLKERFEEYNFVPVFWLEADDHDFNEIRWIKVLSKQNQISEINYLNEIPEEEAKKSVGTLKLTGEINSFVETLKNSLRESEFTEGLFSRISEIYTAGKTLKQAFRELIFWLFDEYGLVILDPQDVNIKNLLTPILTTEITNFREHTQQLVLRSAKLEEIYHAQVKIKPVNLFYSTDEGRYSIEPVDDVFRLKRKRIQFSNEELLNAVRNEPARFSSNVLLRPICQDYLLPTAVYIAGPSEIAYFAQLTPLYDFFKIETPVIYPRASVTIMENRMQNILEKFNLSLQDIFVNSETLKDNVIKSISENNLDVAFEEVSKQIELTIDNLKTKLFAIDKTISDSSDRYREKILSSLDDLKSKALQSQKKKHEITLNQLDKLSDLLYPSQNLQERELNFIYFANKYGDSFLKKIFDEISINSFEHQVIQI
ncbi:MAG: bacillithiol biosynthesis cysteine-adding enzyme BshC [Ignavibacteriaceae bacterium]